MATDLLNGLLPLISRPSSAGFSILEVMHHGTHEKQLSNLWAWLLNTEGSHNLGDAVQRIFVDEINRVGTLEQPVPYGPYGVRQEQNTSPSGDGMDIADIILEDADTSLVIENYYTSDGHGHGYDTYAEYGRRDGRRSVVVLLCETEVRSRLADGWESAPVLVYTRLLDQIVSQVSEPGYQREYPEQSLFITNVHRHFTKQAILDSSELIDFVDALCRSGGAGRYGVHDQDGQAILLGDSLREAAIQRYGESRELLAKLKQRLRDFCAGTLIGSLNDSFGTARFGGVKSNWQGQWRYDVSLMPPDGEWLASIAFGPTAAVQVEGKMGRLHSLGLEPDYTRLLVYTKDNRGFFSTVRLAEVLAGLPADDTRLRDEVLELLGWLARHASGGVEEFELGRVHLVLDDEGAVLDPPQSLAGAERGDQ